MRKLGFLLIVVGVALLGVSFGQYGYMAWRQHELRSRFAAFDSGGAAPAGATAAPVHAAGGRELRLIIPSIHLDDMVVRGADYADLLAGPGLLNGSPMPQDGGNTVIAGHRDTFFRHVADLRAGDAIEVQSRGRLFTYRVTRRDIIKPSDTAVLDSTPQPVLTLVTCYPTYWIGPAPDRLIVRAVRVGANP